MNQLSSNPFVLDSPQADPLRTGKHRIHHIEWSGYTDPSHYVELWDQSGNLIWAAQGQGSLGNITTAEQVGWVNGLLLPLSTKAGGVNMASGRLLVYFK